MAEESVTIVGCGYVGRRLAKLLQQEGRGVLGLVHSDSSLRTLLSAGVPAALIDLDRPAGPRPGEGDYYVYMVPPPPAGDTDPRIKAWLESLTRAPRRVVYLSTTAVYGDRAGAEVTECSETRPSSDRGRRRLNAERALLEYGARSGASVRILRVPGIYGPGRLPLGRIADGQPIPAVSSTGPGNRIHVDDLAGACLAALGYGGPTEIFNVGDGEHASMGEYFMRVARLAGLPSPPQLPLAELLELVSPAMREFLAESRRVDTSLMRSELGYRPSYEDLDSGIAASLSEEPPSGA
jgi:nucleoside-diphosphate-sugar epimerase